MLATAALVLVLFGGGVESRTPAVDAAATQAALRIRVGERADAWSITLDAGASTSELRAHMRQDNGRELDRTFELRGGSVEERSRELAAALALVIEQHATDTSAPPQHDDSPVKPPTPSPLPPEGWLALGGRVGLGHPPDPDGGVTLRGGALWGRGIVQPIASLGTVHARRDTLRVDGVRIGAGIAAGHPIPRTPLWLGGTAMPHVGWTLARGPGRAAPAWSFVTELGVLAQLRMRGVLVGLRMGVELAAPPLKAKDGMAELRFGTARFALGLEVGVLLHTRKASRR